MKPPLVSGSLQHGTAIGRYRSPRRRRRCVRSAPRGLDSSLDRRYPTEPNVFSTFSYILFVAHRDRNPARSAAIGPIGRNRCRGRGARCGVSPGPELAESHHPAGGPREWRPRRGTRRRRTGPGDPLGVRRRAGGGHGRHQERRRNVVADRHRLEQHPGRRTCELPVGPWTRPCGIGGASAGTEHHRDGCVRAAMGPRIELSSRRRSLSARKR